MLHIKSLINVRIPIKEPDPPVDESGSILSLKEAWKYFRREISDEKLLQKIGYLEGLAEKIIKGDRQNYEQNIKNTHKKT